MNNEPTNDDRGGFTSASNAPADKLCPGRHLACKDLPEPAPDPDSMFGTEIHEAMRVQNPESLNLDQASIYEACNEIELKLVSQFFGLPVEGLKPQPVREKRLWVAWPDGLRHSAKSDSVHRKGIKALIVEYKTLPGEVPSAATNQQLRDQAILLDANVPMLQEIGVVPIQPLVTHSPVICVYKREELQRARDELYARVKASNDPASPRIAGDVQCRHCRAKDNCPEYRQWASAIVTDDSALVLAVKERPVAEWDPEMRALFCSRLKEARAWLDDTEAFLKEQAIQDPEYVPGWYMKPGRKDTTLSNPQAIFDALSEHGVTVEQFMSAVDLTKGRLKLALATASGKKGKELDALLDKCIGSNATIKQVAPSLSRKKE